jgi:hypothetical protein
MQDWRIASSRVTSKDAVVSRRGGRIATPPRRLPGGTLHAYLPGAPTTACGAEVSPLRLWPTRPFRRGHSRARCRECLARTDP